jgi:diadenosine tetraphosphate (Ap4A) HIT family hydrolase
MSEYQNCIFCGEPERVIENELAFAHYDSYPVNPGHCLIIPRRHVAEYFQATTEEKAAIWALVDEMKIIIDRDYKPDGYNVGVNIGEAGGQSVPHIHIHMIPRYKGDVEDPRGGVRGVIPHKQKYMRKVRGI